MNAAVCQALTVARIEWRLTRRGLGLWLALALVTLPFLAALLAPHRIVPWEDDGGLRSTTESGTFIALLAAFLITPSYRRDQTARMADLVWARPVNGGAYLLGKALAATLVMAVLLGALTALVALYQLTGGGTVGVPLLVGVLLAVAPALLLAALLFVACGAILPHPLLGILVALLVCSLFGFFLTQSMTLLWNPWAISLTSVPVRGFGPDLPLLLANRLFYGALAPILAGSTLALFAWRDRRALAPRWQGRSALAALVLGTAGIAWGIPAFAAATAAVTLSGQVVVPPPEPLAVNSYHLDLRVDPATGDMRGTARFTIENTGGVPVAAVSLYLNGGLRVQTGQVDGHSAAVGSAPLFGRIALTPPLAPRARAIVSVTYAGRYKLLRPQYALGRGRSLGGGITAISAPRRSVVGDGLAVLYREGDWYPLPWMQSGMTQIPAPIAWRALRIRVPVDATVLASTRDIRRAGASWTVTWMLRGQLPGAVLAVVPPSYARLAVAGGTIYAPQADPSFLRTEYGPYVPALRDLLNFFGTPGGPVAIVVVPPGIGQGVMGVRAAVGDGLALIPPYSLDAPPEALPDAAPGVISDLAPPAPYRAALSDLATAWWATHLQDRDRPRLYPPRIDLPSGYLSLTTRAGGVWSGTDMLAGYTGAAIIGQRDPRAYAQEMDVRRSAASFVRYDPTHFPQPSHQELLQEGQWPSAQRMWSLGLAGRLGVIEAVPALDDLRRAIGAPRLQRLLRQFATSGWTRDFDPDVACALTRATGRPVLAWINRYLGPLGFSATRCL